MMKKIIILTLLLLTSAINFAQNNYQEAVHLKNGRIIRGVIIEQVPNVQIKIETTNDSVFVFQMDEIEKITKERIFVTESPAKKVTEKPTYPYSFSLQSGLAHSFLDLNETRKNYIQYYGLTSKEADRYINRVKNGFFVNADFHYLFTDFFGLGVDYNFFCSTAKGDFLVNTNASYLPVYLQIKSDERMYLHFIAPSMVLMQYAGENKKIRFTEQLAPGALFTRMESRGTNYMIFWGDNHFYFGEPPMYYDHLGELVTGANLAVKLGLSVEYCVKPNWSVGVAGNCIWSNLKKIRYKNINGEDSGTLDKTLDLSHLDYGLIVRYNF